MSQISFLLIFVCGVNSLSKDYMKMRDKTEVLSKGSFEASDEKKLIDIIEAKIKSTNQSAKNKIPLSSCSSSMENNNIRDDHEIQFSRKKNNSHEKNIIETEELHHDHIFSSDEEPKRLRYVMRTNNKKMLREDRRLRIKAKNDEIQAIKKKTERMIDSENSENETSSPEMQTENETTEKNIPTESEYDTTDPEVQAKNEKTKSLAEVESEDETTDQGMQSKTKTDTENAYRKKKKAFNDNNKYHLNRRAHIEPDDSVVQELEGEDMDEVPCLLAQMQDLFENMNQEETKNNLTSHIEERNQTDRNHKEIKNMAQWRLFNSHSIHTAPTNSTIEVSGHMYQDNKATEESEDEGALADYPYSASVQRKGAHYATGALVGERWVLSTASEFYNVRETIKLFQIRLGSVNCKKGGMVTPVKTIAIHPGFVPGKPSYDVSVLGMASAVSISNIIKPIGLSRVSGKVMSAKFLTTYWPRIVVKKGVVPPTAKERIKFNSMRVSTQKLVPSEECSKLLAAVNVTLASPSLCLKAVKAHHSDCMLDVGAPVVAVDGLWGITSGWISPLCPAQPLPTVFTRVSAPEMRRWIEEEMTHVG